ncbi:IclR family transcriptional regulator [Stappia sp. TSB10GB4]|uniref:IclR family transcriptional regulator n=1 Tax=Stappia sp. TSB10GB4 TaxID=2003584 RepID=UPI0016481AA5|nr:IclR family transcriptional regulator [Stappia sp. TSB10GB4]
MKNRQGETEDGEPSGGIQSLDAALRLLRVMTGYSRPMALSEIARDCGMPLSKAHRYLASFLHAGLVEQAGRSGKYDLGAGAVRLGLAALARHDFVNRTAEELPDLCGETGLTGLLSVWGNQGATVIRWERTASPVITSMGLGTTLPLLNSATGRAFLAWAPQGAIQQALEVELQHARHNPNLISDLTATTEGVADLRQATRAAGYATVDGRFIPGLVAIAAPILDWQGEAQAVVTLIGTDPAATRPGSDPVARLRAFAQRLSLT